MLKIHGLKKKFKNFQALNGLDMEIEEGALYGFVGPNGAGKTTAIRIMTGLLLPDEGSVEIGGKDALRYRGIHPNLDLALEHLTPAFLSGLGTERVELRGGDVYCTRFTYETVPDEEAFFEAHRDYLDIHVMLQGSERVEIAAPEDLEVCEERPESDISFLRGEGRYPVLLSPGDFLVVFPEDAHKLKMQTDIPRTVTKAVFKVRIRETE